MFSTFWWLLRFSNDGTITTEPPRLRRQRYAYRLEILSMAMYKKMKDAHSCFGKSKSASSFQISCGCCPQIEPSLSDVFQL